MQRLLLRVVPATLLASAVVVYLSVRAPVARWDRLLILLVMAAAYTGALIALRVVILGGRATWNHVRGLTAKASGPLEPWELYLGICLFIVNVALVLFGHKDVLQVRPSALTQFGRPGQLIVVGLSCGLMLLAFRRLPFPRWFGEPWRVRVLRQASLLLIPLALVLLPPDTAPVAVGKAVLPVAPPPAPPRRPLVVVAVDGVDWKILRSAIGTGRLPNLERAIAQGITADLDNEDYGFSPPVWTTLITGQSRHDHRIYDFVTRRSRLFERPLDAWWEKVPPGFGVKSVFDALGEVGVMEMRLADGRDRHGPSMWQILSQLGYRSLVVNYLLSQPAEEISGVFLPSGSLEVQEKGAELEMVPLLRARGVSNRIRVEFALVAEEFDRFAGLTLDHLKSEPFDLVTFYTPWMDWFNHFLSLEEYENALAGRFEAGLPTVMVQAYQRLDDLIGQLRAARPEANLMIVSDHGVGRGYKFGRHMLQHVVGCPGIFIVQGPDVVRTGTVPPVSMYDVTPTVLGYFAAPLARDFRGRARADVLKLETAGAVVDSYQEALPNRRRPAGAADTGGNIERLRALGYIQ